MKRKTKTDVRGVELAVGDTVAIGADNGSSLSVGRIFKLTDKKVWLHLFLDHGSGRVANGARCRDYDRVVKLCAIGIAE